MGIGWHLIFSFQLCAIFIFAQETAVIRGRVIDAQGTPVESANVAVIGGNFGVTTDIKGRFDLTIPANIEVEIGISHISYELKKEKVTLVQGEERKMEFNVEYSSKELDEVTVKDEGGNRTTMEKIDPKLLSSLPNPSGSIESIIKTLPGVVSTNELSSTYAVRGGNYDENLIYVNDIEVYRPQLYSSGQQEGLSFINSKMVSSLSFSAGGFEARYGDKMSSVLDVRYKKPYSFGNSVDVSLLGFDILTEGSPGSHRFTYMLGVRQRRNNYLLSSLDTKGEYQPVFTDFQAYLTYDISESWEISGLANVALNNYRFIPDVRETEFGTLQQALQLTVYFDGQEISNYETYFGSVTNKFKIGKTDELSVIVSGVRSFEDETADVMGQYFINELDKSADNIGDVAFNRGVGTYLDHARNYLTVEWLNAQLIYRLKKGKHNLELGGQVRKEFIKDRFNEWVLLDSAGFNLPKTPDNPGFPSDRNSSLTISERIRASNYTESVRSSFYVQDVLSWNSDTRSDRSLAVGARIAHWSYNNETIISPRATFTVKPKWKKNYRFQFSSGLYQQQPFYREIRNLDGALNPDIKSQKSIHFIAASHYIFKAWGRPFKFSSEVYYKYMDDLIPYIIDNVRIRYYGENNSHGYATGVDFKINGEFVKNAESWFSLSLMKTEEDIDDDFFINESGEKEYPGYIPRPTDQTVNFSIFFQDYLPNNPTLKFNLTLHYATGLSFGPPNAPKYQHVLRIPPYRRVDMGISKRLLSEDRERKNGKNGGFDSIWLGVEFFNLLGINNTISYIWVKDVTNTTYAVPNYLTNRLINLTLSMNF